MCVNVCVLVRARAHVWLQQRMTFRSWVRTLVVAKAIFRPGDFRQVGMLSVCLVNRYGTSGELTLHLEF
jgi:hypothetical protein